MDGDSDDNQQDDMENPESADLTLAKEMISKRVRPRTVKSYRGCMAKFGKWLALHGGSVESTGLPSLPLEKGLTLTFFGALVQPRLQNDPIFGKPRAKVLENGGHIATSTVTGFKSALIWYHSDCNATIDPSLDKELNLFITGYRKEVGDMKQQGHMNAFEGKQPLSFAGYQMLASRFLEMTPTSSASGNHRSTGDGLAVTWTMGTFGWAFLLLQWNLMARSISVAAVMLSHLTWRDDHLTCTTPRTKTDQTAESAFPKSIFANPLQPQICPVLGIAVFVFCRTYKDGDSPALFDGKQQEDRYSKLLTSLLASLPDSQLAALGAKPSDIGTHSARKGSPTFALSMPGGPTPVSVFLRAGWSLGNVKDRYIFQGEGADQVSRNPIISVPSY
jgi:hypothetical protein